MSEQDKNENAEMDKLYQTVEPQPKVDGPRYQEDATKPAVERVEELNLKQGIGLTYGYSDPSVIATALKSINNLSREDITDEVIGHAALLVDNGNLLYSPQTNEQSYQSDYVISEDTFLRNRIPGRKDSKRDIEMKNHARQFDKSGTLSGSNAVLAISAAMGKSGMFEIPLVNSGIRVALRSPKLTDFVGLEEQLGYNKGQLGRSTLGYIFTHLDVLMTETLYTFIFNFIEKCNVKDWRVNGQVDVDKLRRLIKLSDLFTLVNGLLACYYPEGHNLIQPCANVEAKCTHTEKAKVHFPNMFWVNETMLNEKQVAHLTNSIVHEYTEEEIVKYQNQFNFKHRTCQYKLTEDSALEFEFAVPSLDIHTGAGGAWIKSIESIINANIQNKSDEITKRRLMDKLIDENELKLYSSWIRSITFIQSISDDVKVKLESYSDVVNLIELHSDEVEMIDSLVSGVWKFIEHSSAVVIGIPSYKCPSCGDTPKAQVTTHSAIIPINVVESFFTLLLPSMSKRVALI